MTIAIVRWLVILTGRPRAIVPRKVSGSLEWVSRARILHIITTCSMRDPNHRSLR